MTLLEHDLFYKIVLLYVYIPLSDKETAQQIMSLINFYFNNAKCV